MSTLYRVKAGWDQTLVSLTAFDPQPQCLGLQYTRVTHLADRSTHLEGAFFVLEWNIIVGDADEYQDHLALCGLTTALDAQVTVFGPDINYNGARYNAWAHKPIPGQNVSWSNYFLGRVGLLFTDLEELA